MNGCQIHVEPMVQSSFEPHPRHRGGDADSLKVLLFAGRNRGQPAGGRPGQGTRYWYVMLPEVIRVNENGVPFPGKDWRFQIPQEWQVINGGWAYSGTPVRNLWGLWKYVEGKATFDHEAGKQRPVLGKQSAGILSDATGAHYYVRLKNTSRVPWNDVHVIVCFNSFMSPETGFRPYVNIDGNWVPYQDIPDISNHAYLPVAGMEQAYARTRLPLRWTRPAPSLAIPAIAAWNFVDQGPLLTCHYSRHAVGLGANQEWPCTDLSMWYGDLAPGEEKVCWGHVWVGQVRLVELAEEISTLREAWHQREHDTPQH